MRSWDDLSAAAGDDAAGHGGEIRILTGRLLLLVAAFLLASGGLMPVSPVHASAKDRAQGAVLFKEKGCAHCHSVDGHRVGEGPDLGTVGKRLQKKQIEHQIRDGGKEMPPFGNALTDDEVKKLVDYLAHRKKLPKNVQKAEQMSGLDRIDMGSMRQRQNGLKTGESIGAMSRQQILRLRLSR
jgi:ubiquinol-cytochrome c reductase cytochrome b subunit